MKSSSFSRGGAFVRTERWGCASRKAVHLQTLFHGYVGCDSKSRDVCFGAGRGDDAVYVGRPPGDSFRGAGGGRFVCGARMRGTNEARAGGPVAAEVFVP